MVLPALLLEVVLVVTVLIGLTAVSMGRPMTSIQSPSLILERLRAAARPIGLLLGVLSLNAVVRDVGVDLSWIIGINITGAIHTIEGSVVADIQSLSSPVLTAYFSGVYVYGYVFLLVFPIVAYLLIDDTEPLETTALAYVFNYGVGLLCYVFFIAYGPRNLLPDLVTSTLYESYPRFQILTSEVNANTNVFPSLHASLSTSVAVLAYRTREIYPRWLPIAAVGAISVALATVYLGIHWVTDVVAGVLLGVLAVYAGSAAVDYL